ncbi:MAG TPA: hypothetical protein VLJ68_13110 [Chitinophagaceae bacterium]|nr:hypothetical protein [Chitinophagaceae bacterium]
MGIQRKWNDKIFPVKDKDFLALALEIFHYQYRENPVYNSYVDLLSVDPRKVNSLERIPFLPIRFFRSGPVTSGTFNAAAIFESSGSSATINSNHYVKDLEIYKESLSKCFEFFYGSVQQYCILGLLPSYLERKNASLVYMVQELINASAHPESGFFLDDLDKLTGTLIELEAKDQKTILFGVSFALLDLAEKGSLDLKNTIIIETGGMKGRRKELVRSELHEILKSAFPVPAIHSEYGMTELLSQAYSRGEGIFHTPPWMKIMLRDENDPLEVYSSGPRSGVINIIDLANIHSCAFIATDDVGKLYSDGSFEVMGRVDNSDLRGCSLMVVPG